MSTHDTETCEWPRHLGATRKCSNQAAHRVASQAPTEDVPDPWSRAVCGIHLPRAKRIGWVELAEVPPR